MPSRARRLVRPTLEDGLRALEEAAESAKQVRIELTDGYRALIARVEALPQNQSGADKSGRWRGSRKHWDFVRRGATEPRP